MSPRALLTDSDRFPFAPADLALLDAAGIAVVELPGHAPDAIVRAAEGAEAVFVYHAKVTADLIARLDACRVIARCGSGYDNVDAVAARAAGKEVVYVPDYGIDDVADHALALMLACVRRVVAGDRAMREGRWPSAAELGVPHRLRGSTLGLLGFGRIARAVAERAQAFGMDVLVHDPAVGEEDAARLGVRAVDRDALLGEARIVSLHVPLTPATHRLVGRAELDRLRPGAILVNTSRGEIVDEAALVEALRDGRLAAAGLDVFEREPLPPDSPLRTLPNVVLTPHSAAFSTEALAELRTRSIRDVIRVLRGDRALHPVPA
jgi:phosphoglycerate dehydrogenase-like enzyme